MNRKLAMTALFAGLTFVFVGASACQPEGTVVGNYEDGKVACKKAPKTWALTIQEPKGEDGKPKEPRVVCVDAGQAGTYKVGTQYP